MPILDSYSQQFINHLDAFNTSEEPLSLYAPISYILEIGGKRLRPILTLMAADAYGKNAEAALPAALAIEVFHNFTLLHDDIMDAAPLRRGQATVHHKWDVNTGILSGDAMLILAYQQLDHYEGNLFKSLTTLLSKTALEVCEGQQYDMDFEKQSAVNTTAYLQMIQLKTAVLVGCALKMGALVGGADPVQADNMYTFGVDLGIAFQIQDDILDAFGDPKTFGKQVGGDILQNKKTILYHQAMALGTEKQQTALEKWFQSKPEETTQKIEAVKALFQETAALEKSTALVKAYTETAFEKLQNSGLGAPEQQLFQQFGKQLMGRTL